MRTRLTVVFTFLLTGSTFGAMDARTLLANPQWMPAQTTVTKPVQFQSGLKLAPNEKLDIVALEAEGVVLRKGNSKFMLDVAQTKLLADADAYRASLTPEQQKLTKRDLETRKELWPYFVKMKAPVQFQDRTTFEAGKPYPLWSVEADGPHVYFERNGQTYTIDAIDTDFYAQALAAAAKPTSRLFDEIRANAVRADTGKPAEISDDVKYIALYHAGAWCPHCETSTPDVVKWYDELRATDAGKSLEVVLLSADKSPAEYRKHVQEKQMKFLAIAPERTKHTFVLNQLFPARPTPWLCVVDRQGKMVLDGDADGSAKERTLAVIEQIKQLQQQGAPAKDAAKASADASR